MEINYSLPLPLNIIQSRNRTAKVNAVRQALCLRLRLDGYFEREIGVYINRDHSTVNYHAKKCRELLEVKDAILSVAFNNIKKIN